MSLNIYLFFYYLNVSTIKDNNMLQNNYSLVNATNKMIDKVVNNLYIKLLYKLIYDI